ncbi:YfgM family protein [Frateuria defendens]|uniref:YfgM family protein n=1 Tax=Frateuria defendens TaxID=2219559 RepID=UPI00066FE7DE|nr:tetratricopeptide repeat protein [Frateuria defendens]
MAFEAYDEYEQGEIVRKWLRQNGVSIIVGIAIGLVGIFGWQQWRNHQARHQAEAGQLYQQLQTIVALGAWEQAGQLTSRLQQDYADSPSAVFASSELAQHEAQAKQLDKAEAALNWAESHAGDPALKALMQLNLARVQLAAAKPADALVTVGRVQGGLYAALGEELRGDVLVKLNRLDDARKAYQAALAAGGENAPQRDALQMKLDDLAVAGKQGA